MSPAAYDNTCPACDQPVPSESPRVCCGSCFTYHHKGCWNPGCAQCSSTTTLADTDADRRVKRAKMINLLIGLTILDGIAWALSFPFTWKAALDDVFALDLFVVLGWLLLIPCVWVLTRIP